MKASQLLGLGFSIDLSSIDWSAMDYSDSAKAAQALIDSRTPEEQAAYEAQLAYEVAKGLTYGVYDGLSTQPIEVRLAEAQALLPTAEAKANLAEQVNNIVLNEAMGYETPYPTTPTLNLQQLDQKLDAQIYTPEVQAAIKAATTPAPTTTAKTEAAKAAAATAATLQNYLNTVKTGLTTTAPGPVAQASQQPAAGSRKPTLLLVGGALLLGGAIWYAVKN